MEKERKRALMEGVRSLSFYEKTCSNLIILVSTEHITHVTRKPVSYVYVCEFDMFRNDYYHQLMNSPNNAYLKSRSLSWSIT